MEKTKRFYIFIIYTAILLVSTVLMFIWGFINLNDLFDLTKIWNSLLSLGYIVLALLLTNEAFHWAQEGKR
ncbi:MAG: hypothetical protein GY870_04265, partial [archaeon]|nr:hypothetical protein [archaeon]